MKIYMTGTNGFIATRLRKFLPFTPIPRNILYSQSLEAFVRRADVLIHMGSYGNNSWQSDETEMLKANTLVTLLLLQLCRQKKIGTFIFIGTSSEYGKKKIPMREDVALAPTTMYASTKACGSLLTHEFAKHLTTVVVRPFSIYGEDEDDRKFIPTALRCLTNGQPFKLMKGTHDWVYVDDFCRAMILILKNSKKLSGDAVNIGTGIATTNADVVRLLETITGVKARTIHTPAKGQDSPLWVADNKKLRRLGWKPSVSLKQGLEKIYEAKRT